MYYEDMDNFLEELERRRNKPTFDQLHDRQTFFVRKKLIREVDKLSQKYKRGFKTAFINHAIAKLLREEFGIDV